MADNNSKASLGCGSLILIAIIVLIFSGGRDDKRLLLDLRAIRTDVRNLRTEINAQSKSLSEIREELKNAATRSQIPRQRVVLPVPDVEAE